MVWAQNRTETRSAWETGVRPRAGSSGFWPFITNGIGIEVVWGKSWFGCYIEVLKFTDEYRRLGCSGAYVRELLAVLQSMATILGNGDLNFDWINYSYNLSEHDLFERRSIIDQFLQVTWCPNCFISTKYPRTYALRKAAGERGIICWRMYTSNWQRAIIRFWALRMLLVFLWGKVCRLGE